jgi:phage terminase large subunit-like protein
MMAVPLYKLPPDQARAVLSLAAAKLKLSAPPPVPQWAEIARPEQLPPDGDWRTWLVLAGRGWGKTRTGAETVARWIRDGQIHRVAAVAQTAADARDISMAALRAAAGPSVAYQPSLLRLTWPNGATVRSFSAEDPDALRGYEFDAAWSDEVAAWRYPEAWDQLQFGLRIGGARQIVTTTPRPVRVIRNLLKDPTVTVTRGRTLDNAANLSPEALAYLLERYQGTRLGRQELDAEVLDDVPGALWTRAMIERRSPPRKIVKGVESPDYLRIVVAIDPAVTSGEDSDETGIVVAAKGADGRGYVLADRSCRTSPMAWAKRAIAALDDFGADRIVGEVNNGGDLVETVIRSVRQATPYTAVHASRGKRARAEPIAALYEQGRVSHLAPMDELEDQLCSYTPESGDSPDRLDALVWALTELFSDQLQGGGWGSGATWGGTIAAGTA